MKAFVFAICCNTAYVALCCKASHRHNSIIFTLEISSL